MDENEKQIIEENIDYKDKYIRAIADYQNLKKRTERDKDKNYTMALISVTKNFIPIIDDIQRGAESGDEGMNTIFRELITKFSEYGVMLYGLMGDQFDSNLHNAIGTTNIPGMEDNLIAEVKRPGYRLGTYILRHADVIVNKNN